MADAILHIELAGRNGEVLEQFYGRLFGWAVERNEIGGSAYGWVSVGPAEGCTVGIRHEPEGHAEIVVYVGVRDVADAVARAVKLGATVRIPPTKGGTTRFAVLRDPEGNPFGVIEQDR
jgi:hypothetical protein